MKQRVKYEERGQFLDRFFNFYDAVIRSITFRFAQNGVRGLDLCVSARDAEATENDGWVCVVISIDDVVEMRVNEPAKTTNQVMTQGLHVSRIDARIAVEFGGAVDLPDTLSRLRHSDGYALGDAVQFEVFPYDATDTDKSIARE